MLVLVQGWFGKKDKALLGEGGDDFGRKTRSISDKCQDNLWTIHSLDVVGLRTDLGS